MDKSIIKQDTLDFIFEYIKGAPEIQLKDVELLDNKVIQILSVTSIIIGLIGLVIEKGIVGIMALTSLVIALIAYIVIVILSLVHLKAIEYRRSIQADQLWDTFWDDDITDIKHSLVADIRDAYIYNKEQIIKKRHLLFSIIICAAIEVIAVGAFIISIIL
jgi:hypothetical protein